jgi:hypothetical protein
MKLSKWFKGLAVGMVALISSASIPIVASATEVNKAVNDRTTTSGKVIDQNKIRQQEMLKIVEAFSGIGSQAKAIKNIGIDYKVLCTIDWDVNAIIAYDIIHNGKQDLSNYKNFSLKEINDRLKKYTLSMN